FKIPVVLGMTSREEYLTARVERYPAFLYANRYLNDRGVILTMDQRSYYLSGPSFQNHWALKRVAQLPYAEQLAWLRENHIKHIMIPWDYLNESPALRDGLRPMLMQWSNDDAHFRRIEESQIPRRGGNGLERVAFYDFLGEPPSESAKAG